MITFLQKQQHSDTKRHLTFKISGQAGYLYDTLLDHVDLVCPSGGVPLTIPLIVEDSVYGSIAFYFSSPKDFDEDEIKLASAFADQAALAIENNRLYEAAEEAAVAAERNRLARDPGIRRNGRRPYRSR